jgi:cell division protein FtsB
MRIVIAILLVLLLMLQYKLWLGEGSFRDIQSLEARVAAQEAENLVLTERNQALQAEVEDLRERLDAVEERARSELGLIRDDEEFYQVVPESGERRDEGS